MPAALDSRRGLYTGSVKHEHREMRNVTISLSDDLARWTRVKAAECDKSMSAFIAGILEREQEKDDAYERAMAEHFNRKAYALRQDPSESFPTRAEIYDGPRFR